MKNMWKNALVWCSTVFLTLAAVLGFYFLLQNGAAILKAFSSFNKSLASIWLGLGLAYVLDPLIRFGEQKLREKNMKQTPARILTIAIVLILIGLLLYLIISRLVPRLGESINGLLSDLPGLMNTFYTYLERVNEWNPDIYDILIRIINTATEWVNTNLYATLNTITQSVLGIVTAVVNLFVAIIVLVYAQMSKERFVGQSKKLLYAVIHNKSADMWILDIFRQANVIFSGFITGKIIDSAIVGVICFVCLNFMKMPYALLISVIIGITNIVPVFGPFIGAIPCGILLLILNPVDGLVFAIFILILQQIDGNIIGPRILGSSTGISSFWVIVSVLVFSQLLGVVGMIVGVPIFATLYYIVKRIAEEELARQNLPTDSMEYVELDHINADGEMIYMSADSAKKNDLAKRKSFKESFAECKTMASALKHRIERFQAEHSEKNEQATDDSTIESADSVKNTPSLKSETEPSSESDDAKGKDGLSESDNT